MNDVEWAAYYKKLYEKTAEELNKARMVIARLTGENCDLIDANFNMKQSVENLLNHLNGEKK